MWICRLDCESFVVRYMCVHVYVGVGCRQPVECRVSISYPIKIEYYALKTNKLNKRDIFDNSSYYLWRYLEHRLHIHLSLFTFNTTNATSLYSSCSFKNISDKDSDKLLEGAWRTLKHCRVDAPLAHLCERRKQFKRLNEISNLALS